MRHAEDELVSGEVRDQDERRGRRERKETAEGVSEVAVLIYIRARLDGWESC